MKRAREEEDTPEPLTPGSEDSGFDETEESQLPAAKIAELDMGQDGRAVIIKCALPPHKEPLVFTTYREYEAHYNNAHSNRCVECRKNFPSAHLLDIHIEECHDSFVAVKREKGEQTYSCFVEGCERRCLTPQKRRLHLIDKHMYPRNFFFAVTRNGIDGRRSLLLEAGHRHRRSGTSTTDSRQGPSSGPDNDSTQRSAIDPQPQTLASPEGAQQEDPEELPNANMEGLTGAMSALQFVPPSVRFGRGGRNTGFAKR